MRLRVISKAATPPAQHRFHHRCEHSLLKALTTSRIPVVFFDLASKFCVVSVTKSGCANSFTIGAYRCVASNAMRGAHAGHHFKSQRRATVRVLPQQVHFSRSFSPHFRRRFACWSPPSSSSRSSSRARAAAREARISSRAISAGVLSFGVGEGVRTYSCSLRLLRTRRRRRLRRGAVRLHQSAGRVVERMRGVSERQRSSCCWGSLHGAGTLLRSGIYRMARKQAPRLLPLPLGAVVVRFPRHPVGGRGAGVRVRRWWSFFIAGAEAWSGTAVRCDGEQCASRPFVAAVRAGDDAQRSSAGVTLMTCEADGKRSSA